MDNSYSIFSSSLNLLEYFYNATQKMFNHLKCSCFQLSTDKKFRFILKIGFYEHFIQTVGQVCSAFFLKKDLYVETMGNASTNNAFRKVFFTIHCRDF